MNFAKNNTRTRVAMLASAAFLIANFAMAQDYAPQAGFSPAQLDNLVSRIALYPDPLLAQVLTASTFPDQIQQAAGYSFSHQNLQGQDLANAMWNDNLPWDASVQALIPFPSVMDTMVKDMNWTAQLGNAVLAQRPDVMDAIQRMRRLSSEYGYLQSNDRMRVVQAGPAIDIEPVDAGLLYVPVYDPYLVFAPPRPGFFVGGAIGFRSGFAIGAGFTNWGWGGGFNWSAHTVVVNHGAFGRNWSNHTSYDVNRGSVGSDRFHSAPVRQNNVAISTVNVARDNNVRQNNFNSRPNDHAVQPAQNWNTNRPNTNRQSTDRPNMNRPVSNSFAPQARVERPAPVQAQTAPRENHAVNMDRGRGESRGRR